MFGTLRGLLRSAPPPAAPVVPSPEEAYRRERERLLAAQQAARADLARGIRPAEHRRASRPAPFVSIVIPSITPEKFAAASASFAAAFAGIGHEIIGIHDAASMCAACNRGARDSRGDVVVFAHDDIALAAPDFAARLLDRLEDAEVVGIAGTSRLAGPAWASSGPPHIHGQVGYRAGERRIEVVIFGLDSPARADAQALDGCFLAVQRHVLQEVSFDAASFTGWHLYDVDFTFSAWLAGHRVAVAPDLLLIHQSRGQYDAAWRQAAATFTAKHRAALPPQGAIAPVAVQGLVMESIDEWRLVTERLTAGGSGCSAGC
jgi:hypothetical protein